jgi:hypothetical protein
MIVPSSKTAGPSPLLLNVRREAIPVVAPVMYVRFLPPKVKQLFEDPGSDKTPSLAVSYFAMGC